MANVLTRFFSRIFPQNGAVPARERFSVSENDNTFFVGTRRYDESERDRLEYNRQDVLNNALKPGEIIPLPAVLLSLRLNMLLAAVLISSAKISAPKSLLISFGPIT
jgi:hypothetical protein